MKKKMKKAISLALATMMSIRLLTACGSQNNTPSSNTSSGAENDAGKKIEVKIAHAGTEDSLCLLYTSPSPRDRTRSRMPSSA